ncbi:hypothetical protein KASHIRA_02480 [Serratia phage vB_SmaM-Kashira]|nr:hypothetical protein KASHIRA_02480 [Serratia phage vB_SmaM-Kashira]
MVCIMKKTIKYEYRIARFTVSLYPTPRMSFRIERRRTDKYLFVFPYAWVPVRHNAWVKISGVGCCLVPPEGDYFAEYETLEEAVDSIKKALDKQTDPEVTLTYFDAAGNKIGSEKEGTDLY